ncbi:MAG: hypothetical protein QOI81_2418 [Actinomycetota bacterium]|jgi:uncharacterized protein (DUF58 family)|nr:hypothetical protein [Actinomycetota bacterium]
MPTGRGVAVFLAGLGMWVAARLVGSPGMEVVAIGVGTLPFVAGGVVRWTHPRFAIRRRMGDVRVDPGTRVTVELDVENRTSTASSFLLIEDQLPPSLGRPARVVVAGIGAHRTQTVRYTVLPQSRGRFRIGPLSIDATDPFALTRKRLQFDERDELIVTPKVEDLRIPTEAASGRGFGNSRAMHLFRSGQEYYTMREYQTGDDLRRIHWPSVARTGDLMIRQDESSRRASGMVFLDNRRDALSKEGTAAFEKAVSVAASVGVLLIREGFNLRLATADIAPHPVAEDSFLDELSAVGDVQVRSVSPALANLRAGAAADASLVYVSAPPEGAELAGVMRAGQGFGPRLAVLVYVYEPTSLPPKRQAEQEGRATHARLALIRAGWDVIVLPPSMALRDRWHTPSERQLARTV